MDAHFKILNIINMYGNINFTRIMHFSGIPEVSTRNNLNQLIEHGLVYEGAGEKGTRIMYSLTKEGIKYYNTNLLLVPKAFKINYLDLAPSIRNNFKSIVKELKKGPKTNSQLTEKLDITLNELNLYLIFLRAQEYIELELINKVLYNSLIEKKK